MENQIIKTATVYRNASNEIIIDEEGYITCQTDSGLTFKIHSIEIDLNGPPIKCTIDNEEILISLKSTSQPNTFSSKIITADLENQSSNIAHNLNSFSWNDANTKLFLSLYKDMKELVACRKIKNFKEMWKRITDEMKNSGYDVTAIQVENKWKTLERQYKKVISNNNQTGRGRMTCSYQTELTEILGKRHKIVPLSVTGPEIGVMVRNNNVANSESLLNNSTPILMPVSVTSVLPTSSNIERREEVGDVSMTSDEYNAVTGLDNNNTSTLIAGVKRKYVTETTANALKCNTVIGPENNKLMAVTKKRIANGTTARALEQCREEMKKYRKTLETRQEKQDDVLKQILETYKEIKDRHEKHMFTMENYRQKAIEQRQRRNDLIEEKNNLLKEFLYSLKKNTD